MKKGDLVRIPKYSQIFLDEYDDLVNRAVSQIQFIITDAKLSKSGKVNMFLLCEKLSGIELEYWIDESDLELI